MSRRDRRIARGIKARTRELVELNGGLDAACEVVRIGMSQLQRCYSLSDDNAAAFVPADVLFALEDGAADHKRHPIVTRYLAREHGFVLIERPAAVERHDWPAHLADMAIEFGEVTKRAGEALAVGGDIFPEEVEQLKLIRRADDLVRAAVEMAQALRRRAEERT